MLTDLHVFESGDLILLDVPADLVPATIERLDQFLFSEDVQLADLSAAMRAVGVHGPDAAAVVAATIAAVVAPAASPAADDAVAAMPSMPHVSRRGRTIATSAPCSATSPVVVSRVDMLGVPGFTLFVAPEQEPALRASLVRRRRPGGIRRDTECGSSRGRLSALRRRHGCDHDSARSRRSKVRAISLTKGCYVGQEVIIRVLHRGHGRVAKKLATLRVADAPPAPGAKTVRAGARGRPRHQRRRLAALRRNRARLPAPRFPRTGYGARRRERGRRRRRPVPAVVSARPLAPAA